MHTECLLYSSPKAGLNAVPTVKITLGTPFSGVPAGNDPWFYVLLYLNCAALRVIIYRNDDDDDDDDDDHDDDDD